MKSLVVNVDLLTTDQVTKEELGGLKLRMSTGLLYLLKLLPEDVWHPKQQPFIRRGFASKEGLPLQQVAAVTCRGRHTLSPSDWRLTVN